MGWIPLGVPITRHWNNHGVSQVRMTAGQDGMIFYARVDTVIPRMVKELSFNWIIWDLGA